MLIFRHVLMPPDRCLEKVAGYTGLTVQAVLDTEAAVFTGQESIENGIADELVNNTDALSAMRDALDKRKKITLGGNMKTTTASAETTQPVADASAGVTVDAATPVATVNTASADISAQVSAAVNAENSRIMGILNCEEAKGANRRRGCSRQHRV